MKKKMMLSVAAVAMVGTLAVGGTLAWFTDTETATNVVTTGDVDIQWFEGNPEKPITNADDGIQMGDNVTPGFNIEKNAQIKNMGANDAYVRAKVIYTVTDAEGTSTEVAELPDGYTVEIKNDGKWAEHEGFYYYEGKLAAQDDNSNDDETGLLIGNVSIDQDATDAIANQTVEIKLYAEAIQADNVSEDVLTNAADIAALFERDDVVISEKTNENEAGVHMTTEASEN